MNPVAGQWTYRNVDPDTWMLFYGPRHAGTVRWCRTLRHPALTMQRIIDGLGGSLGPCPARTWGWRPATAGTIELLHNGEPCGEIEWAAGLRDRDRWSIRVVDGMNHDRGPAMPYPEPLPARPTRYVRGDFDLSEIGRAAC